VTDTFIYKNEELRNMGYIDKLNEYLIKTQDRHLSVY